ncbi:MAG TPA: UvrD-helicase domain-containing protein, partial [Polyangiales bacterium]
MKTLQVETAPLSGVTLIEASAGTGKTHTIATLFLRLLLEAELPLSEILVVTYTRAATAELRLRIRARLGEALAALEEDDEPRDAALARMVARARSGAQVARYKTRLSEALRSFDESAIFTIHGFCQRVLRKHAFESGVPFEAELREDQRLLLEEIVCDYWAGRLEHASEHFVAALSGERVTIESLISLLKRTASNPALALLPDREPVSSEACERAFEAARAPISALWQTARVEVERLLADPGMSQVYYGGDKQRVLFDELLPRGSMLSLAELPLEKLERLTPDGLRCKKGHPRPQHPFFDACAAWHAAACALAQCMREQVVAFQRGALEYARAEIARRSEESGTLSFDELLLQLSAALDGAGGTRLIEQVRATHRAALIDEFQDTDPLQCELFRRIYSAPLPDRPAGSLFLIGDPKQAIYAFRGADVFAYMAAARDSVDHAFTLTTNYRSDPALLRAIDALFARARAPFVFDEIAYRSVSPAPDARDRLSHAGAPFEFLFAPRLDEQKANRSTIDARLPRQIAAEIVRFLREKPLIDDVAVEAKHIAVLCRTNAQAMQVQAALREVSVPSVLDGDASVFDSEMAEELARLLWALAEPADGSRVRAALATSAIGVTARALASLEHDEAAWDAWVARFHALHELWETRGFIGAFHGLCDRLKIGARLLALPDGERRYTDLNHLAELLHAEAMQSRKGPHALLEWYRRLRAGEAQRVGMAQQDVQIRLESDSHAVTLTTIHKSKGLQYPIVYCPFMWAGAQHASELATPQFHDRERGDRLTLVLSDPTDLQRMAAKREALAEQ